jgi:hypothetical protein
MWAEMLCPNKSGVSLFSIVTWSEHNQFNTLKNASLAGELDRQEGGILAEVHGGGLHVYKGIDHNGQIRVRNLVDYSSGMPDHESDKPKAAGV